MLYLIGIGLTHKDLSVRALETIKKCNVVYLESYTSFMDVKKQDLEKLFKKKIILADREFVENKTKEILEEAKKKNVAFLVIGDIFSATTHTTLFLEAKKLDIEVETLHGISVLTAVSETGLSLYNFGKTTSIPFIEGNWLVETPYNVIKENKDMHTLVLLDLKENKFMTVSQGIKFLLDLEEKRKEKIFTEEKSVIGCSALGTDKQEIKYGKAKEIASHKFKGFPQCLIIPGKMHFMEEEFLKNLK